MATTRRELLFGCWQEVNEDDRIVTTYFPLVGGAQLPLHARCPRSSDPDWKEHVDRARSLCYWLLLDDSDIPDRENKMVWMMTLDHDWYHMHLAQAQGFAWSPTLYGVAIGRPIPTYKANQEERLVFAVTKLVNLGRGVVISM